MEVLDGVDEGLDLALGQPPGDLVQEQDLGVAGERAGELEPLRSSRGAFPACWFALAEAA